jgi:putative hydrolase of the HAD superfamily
MSLGTGSAVIFDADDTLWDTQPLYERAKRKFSKLMVRARVPTRGLRRKLDELDHANVSRLGYSRRRFPISIRDTYIQLCVERNVPFQRRVADAAYRIGQDVFRESPVVFRLVVRVLKQLKKRGVKCILVTKGDRHVQNARIRHSGLRPYFERIYILPDKRRQDFLSILSRERAHPRSSWSIGNSLRSDIAPALAAGLNAIWIPRSTWIHEEAQVPRSKNLRIARSIVDVPEIVTQTQQ